MWSRKARLHELSGLPDESDELAEAATYRTFFANEKYSFIGEFYDSPEWHALESRWLHMRRLDISNCFRSIYTHSIAWSTGTDYFSKEHLAGQKASDFGNQFDSVMQSASWGETHGIPIGPEASRVFAEIILQDLDTTMRSELANLGLDRSRYEMHRYVDDYFLYADDLADLNILSQTVEAVLRRARFAVNPLKTVDYISPFSTAIGGDKATLRAFLRTSLPSITRERLMELTPAVRANSRSIRNALFGLERREISLNLRPAMRKEGLGSSSTSGMIERAVVKFLEENVRMCESRSELEAFLEHAWDFIHDLVYQYLTLPSVSGSMKVVRALRKYYLCLRESSVEEDVRKILSLQVQGNIRFAINKIVARIGGVRGAEIELGNFLALASACEVEVTKFDRLLKEVAMNSRVPENAKDNHVIVFLYLSLLKYIGMNGRIDGNLRQVVVEQLSSIMKTVWDEGYLPGRYVDGHAAREVITLALASCPYLSDAEQDLIFGQPAFVQWLEERLGGGIRAHEFVRRCLSESRQNSGGSVLGYDWTSSSFDRRVYEKVPEFVY